jgi:putative Mg2+ transporter-C (MgtC) family protein
MRTNMLVCLASLLLVRIGQYLVIASGEVLDADLLRMDPARIMQAIVTGLAFIGAGTIFRDPDQNMARGLTTAATLLVSSTIGMAIAVDRYVLAIRATLLTLAVLRLVYRFEVMMEIRDGRRPPQN